MSVGRRRAPSERGAAAVEFALVVPLLLLLVFGIVQYGYMLTYRQAISQGAAEAARSAAVSFGTTSSAKVALAVTTLNQTLSAQGVTCGISGGATSGNLTRSGTTVGTCSVTVAACANQTTVNCVTVTVDHSYKDHPLIPSVGLGIAMPDHLAYTAVAQVSS